MNSERQNIYETNPASIKNEMHVWSVLAGSSLSITGISEATKRLISEPEIIAFCDRAGTVGLAGAGAAFSAIVFTLYDIYRQEH